jgi:hypothetical protein
MSDMRLKSAPSLMRAPASAYVSIRQHTSAYVSIRQHTSAYVSIHDERHASEERAVLDAGACVSIRQHTSAYTMSDMRLKSAPSLMRVPARLSGTQITCFTGTKVQILTLDAGNWPTLRCSDYLLYWYKSTNTDT